MTAGTITAHAVHSTSLETPPVRAVKAITTIQKYGRMIGAEITTRKASTADWAETLRRHALRASAGQSGRASIGEPATASLTAINAPRFAVAAGAFSCPSGATARAQPPRRSRPG